MKSLVTFQGLEPLAPRILIAMLWSAGRPSLQVVGAELLLNPFQKLLCWVPEVLCVGYSINSEALGVIVLCTTDCQKTEDSASLDSKQLFYIQQPATR